MSSFRTHRFARRLFLWAGIYGMLALVPLYFLEQSFGQAFPPATNRPEQYYGFVGVALAWQFAFVLISRDVVRFRPMMLPAAAEKLLASGATVWLFLANRVDMMTLTPALIDLSLGLLFLLAFTQLQPASVGDVTTAQT